MIHTMRWYDVTGLSKFHRMACSPLAIDATNIKDISNAFIASDRQVNRHSRAWQSRLLDFTLVALRISKWQSRRKFREIS